MWSWPVEKLGQKNRLSSVFRSIPAKIQTTNQKKWRSSPSSRSTSNIQIILFLTLTADSASCSTTIALKTCHIFGSVSDHFETASKRNLRPGLIRQPCAFGTHPSPPGACPEATAGFEQVFPGLYVSGSDDHGLFWRHFHTSRQNWFHQRPQTIPEFKLKFLSFAPGLFTLDFGCTTSGNTHYSYNKHLVTTNRLIWTL